MRGRVQRRRPLRCRAARQSRRNLPPRTVVTFTQEDSRALRELRPRPAQSANSRFRTCVRIGRGVACDRRAPPGDGLRPRAVRPAQGRLHLLPVAHQSAAGRSGCARRRQRVPRRRRVRFLNAPIPLALRGGFWHDPDHTVRYDPSPALDDIDRLFRPPCPAAPRRPTTPSGPDLGVAARTWLEINGAADLSTDQRRNVFTGTSFQRRTTPHHRCAASPSTQRFSSTTGT